MTGKRDITAEIQALKGSKQVTDQVPVQVAPKVEKLKSEGKTPGHRSIKENGGARDGAGRKPGGTADQKRLRKEMVNAHYKEEAEIQIVDKKTGKIITQKKPRIIVALEKLFQIGMKGQGDKDALDKWLNRAIGKPAQPIIGGDEDDEPVHLNIDVDGMLEKIYGDKEK